MADAGCGDIRRLSLDAGKRSCIVATPPRSPPTAAMSPEERARTLELARGDAPEPGGYLELAGGILWIRLPIPGALRHINVWLVPGSKGWFLVDTGMKTRAVREAWESLEGRLPLARELEFILVTHHHPDHFGMAQWLSERFEVRVTMHDMAAAAAVSGMEEPEAGPVYPSDGFTQRLGVELDPEMQSILRGGSYRAIVSGRPEITTLRAEATLPGADGVWRTSVHDGHAPGHVCLHDDASRVLISGDQLLPTISSNISLYPSNEQGDPLGDYLVSLERLARLPEDTLILPAHGRPFMSLHARIEALRQEHAGRLQQIRDVCAGGQSTSTVTASLFRMDRLDALNRLLATTETLAHLRHLELMGDVERCGRGVALKWTRP
jgi:glyoxylase-like metal-dependent hydrolase (beta-lactamase superfamily II)